MSAQRSQLVVSYVGSTLIHLGLIATAIWQSVPGPLPSTVSQTSVQTVVTDSYETSVEESHGTVGPLDRAHASADRTVIEAAPSADDPGLAAFARARLERARKAAQDQSSEKQLADLEKLGRQLEQVSNRDSIEQTSQTLSQWLGVSQRTTQPAKPAEEAAGEFDSATAQISDVRRVESTDGVTFIATLVDAQGHTVETPLDESDGQRLYETFQLIKRFPLLDAVYRGTVMGLLDKLIHDQQVAGESAPEPDAPQPERPQ